MFFIAITFEHNRTIPPERNTAQLVLYSKYLIINTI
jgi:hypothetical protein